MKITKRQLKRIIREEYSRLAEQGTTIMGLKGQQGQQGQVVATDPTSGDLQSWDFEMGPDGRPLPETLEEFFWAAADSNETDFDRVDAHFGGHGCIHGLMDIWDELQGQDQIKLEKALYAIIQGVDPVYALHNQTPRY